MKIKEKIEILHWDTTWDELPDRIKTHFSENEAEFYKSLLNSRNTWIDGCKNGAVKSFLENLRKNDNFRVYIKSENAHGPYIYWFTSFVQEHDGIAVRLPTKAQLPGNPPECVREVYRYIGGVDENLDYYCGWDPPEEVKPMSETGWDIKSSKTKDCYGLFHFGNGDIAGYITGGGGFIFDHEESVMMEFDIEEFINIYFGNFFNRRDG